MLGFLKKIKENFIEKKQYAILDNANYSYEYTKTYNSAINFFIASYYQCSPVAIAVNLIADSVANLPFSTIDRSGEFNYNADILKRLQMPNRNESLQDFISKCITQYLLVGNVFIDLNKVGSSFELTILEPQNITYTNDNRINNTIIYTPSDTSNQFYREYRYDIRDNYYKSSQGSILLHFKNINISNIDKIFGISFLASAQLEISQYLGASVHNNAMIKNGCKPSLAMIVEDATQDQIASFQDTLRSVAGAENSGKPIGIVGKVKIEKFSESIRDMDFDRLKVVTSNKIAQVLKIPLPLINENSMTYSNFSQSQLALYDNCVLPIAKKFIAFLNNRLLRILGEVNYKLTIDESAISALELRKIELANSYSKTNAMTINEVRTMLGYEALAEGGDVIYQPQNMVPIGKDGYTIDNRESPTEKAFLYTSLKEQGFSENEIALQIDKYFK